MAVNREIVRNSLIGIALFFVVVALSRIAGEHRAHRILIGASAVFAVLFNVLKGWKVGRAPQKVAVDVITAMSVPVMLLGGRIPGAAGWAVFAIGGLLLVWGSAPRP